MACNELDNGGSVREQLSKRTELNVGRLCVHIHVFTKECFEKIIQEQDPKRKYATAGRESSHYERAIRSDDSVKRIPLEKWMLKNI